MSKESPEEMESRVRLMSRNRYGTWDLSPNDRAALRHVLAELARLRTPATSVPPAEGERERVLKWLGSGDAVALLSEALADGVRWTVADTIKTAERILAWFRDHLPFEPTPTVSPREGAGPENNEPKGTM